MIPELFFWWISNRLRLTAKLNKGTHWWHSHNGLQRGDGLAGPIIVRQPSQVDVHSRLYDTGLFSAFVWVLMSNYLWACQALAYSILQ